MAYAINADHQPNETMKLSLKQALSRDWPRRNRVAGWPLQRTFLGGCPSVQGYEFSSLLHIQLLCSLNFTLTVAFLLSPPVTLNLTLILG